MLKEICSFDEFVKKWDELKETDNRLITNNMHDITELKTLFETRKICYCSDNSIFLLNRIYDYDDVIFISCDLESLSQELIALNDIHEKSVILRIWTVFSNETEMDKAIKAFEYSGFSLKKKIGRFITIPTINATKKTIVTNEVLLDFVTQIPQDIKHFVGFPDVNDAEEILQLLLTEFDPVGDSLPTVDEIRKNILAKQTVVVKNIEKQIISCSYFEIKNNIFWGIYDVTLAKYRRYFPWFAIKLFVQNYHKEINLKISRIYGWKDLSNTKLVKGARNNNQMLDKVRICVFTN